MHVRKDPMPVAGSLMHAISEHCTLPPARPASDIMHAMHVAVHLLHSSAPAWLQRATSIGSSQLPNRIQSWLQGLWHKPLKAVQVPEVPYLVCTVGSLEVWPGASNVIPSTVNFTVDIRSDNDNLRTAVEKWLQVRCTLYQHWHMKLQDIGPRGGWNTFMCVMGSNTPRHYFGNMPPTPKYALFFVHLHGRDF